MAEQANIPSVATEAKVYVFGEKNTMRQNIHTFISINSALLSDTAESVTLNNVCIKTPLQRFKLCQVPRRRQRN